MGDPSETPTDFHNTLGIPKTASLTDIRKAYKSLVRKCHPDKNPWSDKAEAQAKFTSIHEAYRALSIKKTEEKNIYACNGDHFELITPKQNKSSDNHQRNNNGGEEFRISNPTLVSRTTSRTPSTTPKYLISLSKETKSRRSTTPILFSQSAVRRKPHPIEKKLQCTLEELCGGCVKKIKITRDAIATTGLIVQEEEILKIKVKPGWKKGTKITFEEKGDEKPGTLPADIIFVIDEKRHPMFKRAGDDLDLGVEIPLVQALTGCKISVPLLGGGQVTLSIEDVIYPGYEKIIPGQGMPKSKGGGKRGDLRLRFLVEFPSELSDQQRSEIASILQERS